LDEFDRQLAAAGAADRVMLLLEAARVLRAEPVPSLASLPALLLDVRVGTPAEEGVLAALVASSPALLATVPVGDHRTLQTLERQGARRYAEAAALASRQRSASSSLDRLQRQLFSENATNGEVGEDVELFSAPGEGRECVEVARRILREVRRGVPFDDIAIVVRAPESYWGLLEHALQRAGVKAWFSRGTRRPDPSARPL